MNLTPTEQLDRHALVMALWVPSSFVFCTLLHMGLNGGGGWWIATGFAFIIATFIAHIILNVLLGTGFSKGETAFGGVVYSTALLVLLLTSLTGAFGFPEGMLLPFGLGLAAILASVIIYLLIAFGPVRAFEKFDVIRDNNLRAASRLPHRGGRK